MGGSNRQQKVRHSLFTASSSNTLLIFCYNYGCRYAEQYKIPLRDTQRKEFKNSSTQVSPHVASGLHIESDKHEEFCTINEELNQIKKKIQRQGGKGRKE